MKRNTLFFFVLLTLAVALVAQPLQAQQTTTKPPAVDPRAKQILKQMSDYLSGLDSFSVRVMTTREIITPSSVPLDSDHTFDLSVQRPNGLYGEAMSGQGTKKFYYDGENFTIYTPSQKYYASFAAPPTFDGLFQEMTKYGLEMPAADLLFSNPYQAMTHGVISGTYVGDSLINGVIASHLAFQTKSVDWQLWVMTGDQPLPVRLVITEKLAEGWPSYMASFTNWNVSPTLDRSLFTFTPGEGDKKIGIKKMVEPMIPKAPTTKQVPKK